MLYTGNLSGNVEMVTGECTSSFSVRGRFVEDCFLARLSNFLKSLPGNLTVRTRLQEVTFARRDMVRDTHHIKPQLDVFTFTVGFF